MRWVRRPPCGAFRHPSRTTGFSGGWTSQRRSERDGRSRTWASSRRPTAASSCWRWPNASRPGLRRASPPRSTRRQSQSSATESRSSRRRASASLRLTRGSTTKRCRQSFSNGAPISSILARWARETSSPAIVLSTLRRRAPACPASQPIRRPWRRWSPPRPSWGFHRSELPCLRFARRGGSARSTAARILRMKMSRSPPC